MSKSYLPAGVKAVRCTVAEGGGYITRLENFNAGNFWGYSPCPGTYIVFSYSTPIMLCIGDALPRVTSGWYSKTTRRHRYLCQRAIPEMEEGADRWSFVDRYVLSEEVDRILAQNPAPVEAATQEATLPAWMTSDAPEPEAPVPANPSGWISWAGGAMPVAENQMVEYVLRGGGTGMNAARDLSWNHRNPDELYSSSDIVMYRPARETSVRGYYTLATTTSPTYFATIAQPIGGTYRIR